MAAQVNPLGAGYSLVDYQLDSPMSVSEMVKVLTSAMKPVLHSQQLGVSVQCRLFFFRLPSQDLNESYGLCVFT